MITVTGTVGASGKYLLTGSTVDTTSSGMLKMVFENKTSGTNLALCAGTDQDFAAGKPGIQLSGSGGPGFTFLTIIDANKLSGKVIYVLRQVGAPDSQFTLTLE